LQNLLETSRASAQFLKNADLASAFPAKPEVLQLAQLLTVFITEAAMLKLQQTIRKRLRN